MINQTHASTISAINLLSDLEKRKIYSRVIPEALFEHFHLSPYLVDKDGNSLLELKCARGTASVEMAVYHKYGFLDPVLYGQIADTLNGQVHVMLYVLNDPGAERFNVDRLDDGTRTLFGTHKRNLAAEVAAMEYGLAPGQIRKGLRMLKEAINAFEKFVISLGQELYFAEPLYYHNAILFERYGFAYQQGRRLMERIQKGFSVDGDLIHLLDGTTPFRRAGAENSIRLRSWAIHDNILGEPFTNVTMYKRVGRSAGVDTSQGLPW